MPQTATSSEFVLSRIASGSADEDDRRTLIDRHGPGMRRAALLAIHAAWLVDDAV